MTKTDMAQFMPGIGGENDIAFGTVGGPKGELTSSALVMAIPPNTPSGCAPSTPAMLSG
jgi:hypothetical protein